MEDCGNRGLILCVHVVDVKVCVCVCFFLFFFFQAEDGIRDDLVTGVQTCALPILKWVIPMVFCLGIGGSKGSLFRNGWFQWVVPMFF